MYHLAKGKTAYEEGMLSAAREYLTGWDKDLPQKYKAEFNQLMANIDKNEKALQVKAKIEEEKAKKEEARRIAKEKAERKKQGVSIGMTKEEVLQSMWGKPNDINRTIGEGYENEQWCYDGYNYLYFEDGILTTIQN